MYGYNTLPIRIDNDGALLISRNGTVALQITGTGTPPYPLVGIDATGISGVEAFFVASSDVAIVTQSTGGGSAGIFSNAAGVNAQGIRGSATGTGATAVNSDAEGDNSFGVYGFANGANATAVYAECSGVGSIALVADGPLASTKVETAAVGASTGKRLAIYNASGVLQGYIDLRSAA